MTAMTPQAVEVAIDTACRTLRLPTIRERAAHAAATAAREQHTYQGFLAELLLAECDDRDERRRTRRVQEAGFPRPKRLDDIDYTANTNLNPAVINTLAGGEWIAKGRPLCLIGDSGTGKTHLLIGIGTAAEAENDRALTKVIARYGRVDLLCLDELGYLQLDRRGAELLFQVLTEREEKTAIAIASNEPFSGWTKTFTDPRLCAAIVDRLTYDATIIETGTTSYRLAHTRATSGATSSRPGGAKSG